MFSARKGGGAPRGNKNAAGPHKPSSRFKSFAVGAVTGMVGSGVHAAMNTAAGAKVRTGMHALGTASTPAVIGGAIGGIAAGSGMFATRMDVVKGASLGAAVGGLYGAAAGTAGSLAGKYIGSHYGAGKRNKKNK